MKIIALGASSSKNSINKKLATYVAKKLSSDVSILDLNDYDLPLYSIDIENESGIPETVVNFYNDLRAGDLIVLSLAEHNSSYSAAFKNILDWTSRHEKNFFEDKKLFLLSTSPGGRGGQSVMVTALGLFPRLGAEIIGQFSLPRFYDTFNEEKGITDQELNQVFSNELDKVKAII